MCGLAGYFGSGFAREEGRLVLENMTGAISHRGPDGRGFYVGSDIGLGHTRLSIVDLAHGGQPMSIGEGAVWITFNGEIFNYVELRNQLIAKGRVFRTSSDTEVILHLYREMGPDCVGVLNGDFAFAIWDAHRRRLMLARDRVGVRPLFYATWAGKLFFASEAKSLLEIVEAEINLLALDEIFTLWSSVAPRTIFKNISELPPAHMMLSDRNGSITKPYWHLSFPDRGDEDRIRSERVVAEELRSLLDDATRIRLRADVPVGAYLSGGLDSSIISALAAPRVSDGLRTFSVTFDSAEHDESLQQNEMVRYLGTHHSAIACQSRDIAEAFPDVVRHMECPVIRTAPAPLFMLSGMVRDHGLKVVLTGEGADEVFAGYDIFKEGAVRLFCARQPGSRLRMGLFRKLYPYLPGLQQQSPDYLAAFFGANIHSTEDLLYSHRLRYRNTAAAKMFFSQDLRNGLGSFDATEEIASRLPAEFRRWHPLHQAQYIETTFLLPGYILSSQGDRMAMAHGVEGRFPFLDHRLIEFAAQLPPSMKLRGLKEKRILRQATKEILPPSIGERAKQPYRAPDSQSFTGVNAPDYVASALTPAAIEASGLFNPQAVDKLYAKCQHQGAVGFRENTAFVGILSTQLWNEIFVAGSKFRKTRAA